MTISKGKQTVTTVNKSEIGLVPEELPDDPMDVVTLGVSSTNNNLCMKGECNNCKGSSLIDEICKMIQRCDSLISFSK